MRIIISPALRMEETEDFFVPKQLPILLDRTKRLAERLKALSLTELRKILSCNEKIAMENYQRYQHMQVERGNLPALFAYTGIQYQYMHPQVFAETEYDYLEEHLRILSGFYGILRPFDGICAHRLEMQAKLTIGSCKDVYSYWGDTIYTTLKKETKVILNLTSREYGRAVLPYLDPSVRLVTCRFLDDIAGQHREKVVYVKMARGAMVRFLAEQKCEEIEQITEFQAFGYRYRKDLSNPSLYVFVR